MTRRRILLAVTLWLAASVSSGAGSEWERAKGGRRSGGSAWKDVDLAAIGQRLGQRLAAAPASKTLSVRQASGPLDPGPISANRMGAEGWRPPGWSLAWRHDEDTPAYLSGPPPAARPLPGAATRPPARLAMEVLEAHRELFALAVPRDEVRHVETVRGPQGRLHVAFARHVEGVPVWGEDLVVHMDGGGGFYAFNGRYSSTPTVAPPRATLSASSAIGTAREHLARRTPIRALSETVRALLDYAGPTARLFLRRDEAGGSLLPVWCVEIRPNLQDRWLYFVDAVGGDIIDQFNATPSEGPVTALATGLLGQTRSLNVYEVEDAFVMIDGSRPSFAEVQPNLIGAPRGALVTLSAQRQDLTRSTRLTHVVSEDNVWTDAVAVSAHAHMGTVFDYYLGRHGRLSIDGRGGSTYSIVHVTDDGAPMDNAFWSGTFMAYGDGAVAFEPLARALDVAAHEMTHGVIQYTVNLEYRDQSGALNESLADVFAAMVDRDDWLLGEDAVKGTGLFPSGALRDMADPHNGAAAGGTGWQPAHMDEFRELPTSVDNGGVHINSGIPNRACFLIAEAIGRDKTEAIYYHILDARLINSRGNFVDMRRAALLAARELFGADSQEEAAVAAAFTEVGIVGDDVYEAPERRAPAAGEEWLLVVNATPDDRTLYLVAEEVTSEDDIVRLTSTPVYGGTGHAVSVSADGSFVLFVDENNDLRGISIDGSDETVLNESGDFASIALSPDRRRLAATSVRRDSSIVLFDLVQPERSKSIALHRPTTQEGVATDVVLFADAMDWDPDSQYLIYDAFNAIPTVSGDSLSFWDVNLLEPDEEFIVPLLPPQPEGLQLGNPRFAHTSGRQVVFDRYDSRVDSNEIWIFDLATGDAGFIVSSGDAIGFPSFSVDDSELVFEREDAGGRRVVSRIELDDTRLAARGAASDFLIDARTANWLAIVDQGEPTAVEEEEAGATPATFTLLPNRPNPFNPSTTIGFQQPRAGEAIVDVYDMRGVRVARLLDERRPAGEHRVTWHGTDERGRAVASGVYVVRVRIHDDEGAVRQRSRRMALVR